jgi:hypothetical protein
MKQPYLIVGLDQKDGKPSLKMIRGVIANDGSVVGDQLPFSEVSPLLEDLNALGGMGARENVGKLALLMLARGHMDDFKPFPELVAVDTSMETTRDCVEFLIDLTRTLNTSQFIPIIDNLMATPAFAKELSGTDVEKNWAVLKPRYETIFKGK